MSPDLKTIEPEKYAPISATYQDLLNDLPDGQGKYVLYYLDAKENKGKSKAIFIAWIPEEAKMKDKMIYAGSIGEFLQDCKGANVKITASERSNLTYQKILAEAAK